MLSGHTQRRSSPPRTGTGPLSKRRGFHMAPGTALWNRWVETGVRGQATGTDGGAEKKISLKRHRGPEEEETSLESMK